MIDPREAELHDSLVRAGNELLEAYVIEGGLRRPASDAEAADLRRACTLYEQALGIYGENWNVLFGLALARRALGDYQAAYEASKRAYTLQSAHEDVAREHAAACMIVRRDDEAVAAALRVAGEHPADAGHLANLALALLFAEQVDEAWGVVSRALEIDPNDGITLSLGRVLVLIIDRRFDDAEELARVYVERNPGDPVTARIIATTHALRDRVG